MLPDYPLFFGSLEIVCTAAVLHDCYELEILDTDEIFYCVYKFNFYRDLDCIRFMYFFFIFNANTLKLAPIQVQITFFLAVETHATHLISFKFY